MMLGRLLWLSLVRILVVEKESFRCTDGGRAMLVGGWDNSPPGRIDPLNLGFLGINFNNMVLGRLLRLSLVRILVVEKKIKFFNLQVVSCALFGQCGQ